MSPVFATDALAWRDLTGLSGARGYEFKALVDAGDGYTRNYSCELVRLGPSDHSVPHTEPWNHALYFLTGTGEIAIGRQRWPVAPGTFCKVKAGEPHALVNHGPGEMTIFVVYDPPRDRAA